MSDKTPFLPTLASSSLHVVVYQLESGQDVIMSDADALWLADPMQDFTAPHAVNSSIVASRGSFPHNLGERWGSTMCMGFILFRTTANEAMGEFLVEMKQLAIKHGDDQVAVNNAASQLGIKWDKQSGDMRYEESQGFGYGTIDSLTDDEGRPFTVTLLPHNTYTRQCLLTPLSEMTVVAHCLSKRSAGTGAKIDWIREAGLWPAESDATTSLLLFRAIAFALAFIIFRRFCGCRGGVLRMRLSKWLFFLRGG